MIGRQFRVALMLVGLTVPWEALSGCRPRHPTVAERGSEVRREESGRVAPLAPPAEGTAGTRVEQSDDNPYHLIVACPWQEYPKARLQVALALEGSRVGAEETRPTLKGEVDFLARLAKSHVESTGMGFEGRTGTGCWYGRKNRLGRAAAYWAAATVQDGPPRKKEGAVAVYFELADWANDETNALEVELNPDYFEDQGELCVKLFSADGEEVASATTHVDFERAPKGSGTDE